MKTIFPFACVLLFSVWSCNDDDNGSTIPAGNSGKHDVVYTETNDYNGQNAILAYRDDGNGNLTPIPGSPFATNGSGVGNPLQLLGPSDSDYELNRSADGKFLLAVNSGSNTIAVFSIGADGTLSHVPGSPFPSGGETPVGIDVSGNYVFVVNKSQNPLSPTTSAPNYSTFTIDAAGHLTAVAGAKFETTPGSSPSNGLVSKNNKFLFATDFLGFMLPMPVGTLRSFRIETNGSLSSVSGSPYTLPLGMMPPDNGALGLWEHPTADVLYVGIPAQGKIGVFNINQATGALTLQTTVPAGKAACWIRNNQSGNRMYVLNSGDDTVQVYNTSSPLSPSSLQTLALKNSGPEYTNPAGAIFKTSQGFSLHLSTDEKILYVVTQHTNMDFSIGNFNYLHSISVNGDGTLTENTNPIQLPVSNMLRPKGSLVINLNN